MKIDTLIAMVVCVIAVILGVIAGQVFTPISMVMMTFGLGMAVLWYVLLRLFMKKRLFFFEASIITCSFVIPMWVWDFFMMSRYNDIPAILNWLLKQ